MAKQKDQETKSPTRVPDKEQFITGDKRQKTNQSPKPYVAQAANRPTRKANPLPEKVGDGGPNEGKWKAAEVPPYSRTYAQPLDEDGNPEQD